MLTGLVEGLDGPVCGKAGLWGMEGAEEPLLPGGGGAGLAGAGRAGPFDPVIIS